MVILFVLIALGLTLMLFSGSKPEVEIVEPDDYLKAMREKVNPNQSGISADYSSYHSELRTTLYNNMGQEVAAVASLKAMKIAVLTAEHEIAETPERLKKTKETNDYMHESQIASYKNNIESINKAAKKGLSVDAWMQIEKQRELDILAIEKHEAMGQADIKLDMQEKLNTLDAILKYKHMKFAEFNDIAKMLVEVIKEEQKVMKKGASVDELEVVSGKRETYQKLFAKYKQDLLETGDGQAVSGPDPLTQIIGGGGTPNQATPQPVPVKRGRGRPRKNISI